MDNWIPVIGALTGVIVGGGISYFAQRMSAIHARQTLLTNLAEDRARWAVERQLSKLQDLYAELHHLIDSVEDFRIYEARKIHGYGKNPEDRNEYNTKRGRYENAVAKVHRELLLLDDELLAEFNTAIKPRKDLRLSLDKVSVVNHLMDLQESLVAFAESVAKRYAKIFQDRRDGNDRSVSLE